MNARLRILHLEDSRSDAELVEETLAAAGIRSDVTRVDTESDFVSALQQGRFDLILADYSVPSFDGMSACHVAQRQSPGVPFVFVSGTLGEDAAIESLKIGATDYVLKTRLSRLVPSVERAMREAKEREELRRSESALRRSEAYLAIAQSLSHTGSFGWHLATGEIFWSQETYRIFELDPLTKPTLEVIWQRVHPDDRTAVQRVIDGVSRVYLEDSWDHLTSQRRRFDYEHRLLMPDGRVKHLQVSGRVLRDESGDTEFVGAVTDVTAAKEAQHELLEARVSERTRIARDLHDTLLQSFHGLLLRFHAAYKMLPDRPREAKERLKSAIEQAEASITEGRNAVQGLRDPTLHGNDLAQAMTTLGEKLVSDATNPPATFEVSVAGEPRKLRPLIRDEIYKIGVEAVRNAFQHARAERVEVEIEYGHERFRLRVHDDGTGIDPAVLCDRDGEGHYGLRGMRERATILGGQLEVRSEVGIRTEVEVCVAASTAYL